MKIAWVLTLCKSLILPHLEYCVQLWAPFDSSSILAVEAVQRNFTPKISGLENYKYWERLAATGLYSLQRNGERNAIS